MKCGSASLPFNGNLQQVIWDLSKRALILCCTGVLDSFPLNTHSYLICIANEPDFSLLSSVFRCPVTVNPPDFFTSNASVQLSTAPASCFALVNDANVDDVYHCSPCKDFLSHLWLRKTCDCEYKWNSVGDVNFVAWQWENDLVAWKSGFRSLGLPGVRGQLCLIGGSNCIVLARTRWCVAWSMQWSLACSRTFTKWSRDAASGLDAATKHLRQNRVSFFCLRFRHVKNFLHFVRKHERCWLLQQASQITYFICTHPEEMVPFLAVWADDTLCLTFCQHGE